MGKRIETAKAIIGFGVSLGAGIIVGNIVNVTTPSNIKLLPKILVKAGTFALAGYAGEKAAQYTNETIDDVTAVFGFAKDVKERVEFIVHTEATPKPADTQ